MANLPLISVIHFGDSFPQNFCIDLAFEIALYFVAMMSFVNPCPWVISKAFKKEAQGAML